MSCCRIWTCRICPATFSVAHALSGAKEARWIPCSAPSRTPPSSPSSTRRASSQEPSQILSTRASVRASHGADGQRVRQFGTGHDPGTDAQRDEREAVAGRKDQRARAVRLGLWPGGRLVPNARELKVIARVRQLRAERLSYRGIATRFTWLKLSQVGCLNKPLRQQYFGLRTCHLAHLLGPSQARRGEARFPGAHTEPGSWRARGVHPERGR